MEEQKKKKKKNISRRAAEPPHNQNLPHEVIVDNILTRLPIQNLAKECASVCKLWYESITHPDPHFVSLHTSFQSAYHNNNRHSSLIFDILNNTTMRLDYPRQCTLRFDIDDDDNDNDVVYNFRKLSDIGSIGKQEPVGHCNGLRCLRSCCVRGECLFHITNPSCRPDDFMVAMYRVPDDSFVFCCGFGFDSLVNEYKIVLVYTNSSLLSTVIDVHDKFKCIVFTLGSTSWRESTGPNTLPVMSTITGITQEKKRVVMSRMSYSRSATYVGGALYWRVLTRDRFGGGIGYDEEDLETEMLLLFDIHHEQFGLISLPLECEFKIKTGTTTINTQQEQQLTDHRLLEFEGCPCIVRLQTGQQQQPRNSSSCGCKVHLYVMRDRVKSAWSIETFDVCGDTSMIRHMSDPRPCIIAAVTSAKTTSTTTITTATTIASAAATTTSTRTTSTAYHTQKPITEIVCVADRVILYWFDGACVQFYDLRRKCLKMVKYTTDPTKLEDDLFTRSGRRQLWPYADDGVDTTSKLIYCRRDNIDSKLHIYVENSRSLKTFIPKGCTTIYVSRDYRNWYAENKYIVGGVGFVYTNGKNGKFKLHYF